MQPVVVGARNAIECEEFSCAVDVTLHDMAAKRPSARIGSSRLTRAPSCMRENDVRFQVSSAKSKVTEPGVMSTAVKQTPLTAMESPFLSSLAR